MFLTGATYGQVLCAELTIIDDNDVECNDVFMVSLSANSQKVVIPSQNGSATVTIAVDQNDGECQMSTG